MQDTVFEKSDRAPQPIWFRDDSKFMGTQGVLERSLGGSDLIGTNFPTKRGVKLFPKFIRQGDGLGAAEEFNGLFRLIHDHRAVFAMLEMALEFLLDGGLEIAVDVIREFANDAFAVQLPPPWRK
jgi:hypothetical protein